MTQALKKIQDARDQGLDITADIYPYIRNGVVLGSFLPPASTHVEPRFLWQCFPTPKAART